MAESLPPPVADPDFERVLEALVKGEQWAQAKLWDRCVPPALIAIRTKFRSTWGIHPDSIVTATYATILRRLCNEFGEGPNSIPRPGSWAEFEGLFVRFAGHKWLNGYRKLIKRTPVKGPLLDDPPDEKGWSPQHEAMRREQPLLDDPPDEKGWSPQHEAMRREETALALGLYEVLLAWLRVIREQDVMAIAEVEASLDSPHDRAILDLRARRGMEFKQIVEALWPEEEMTDQEIETRANTLNHRYARKISPLVRRACNSRRATLPPPQLDISALAEVFREWLVGEGKQFALNVWGALDPGEGALFLAMLDHECRAVDAARALAKADEEGGWSPGAIEKLWDQKVWKKAEVVMRTQYPLLMPQALVGGREGDDEADRG